MDLHRRITYRLLLAVSPAARRDRAAGEAAFARYDDARDRLAAITTELAEGPTGPRLVGLLEDAAYQRRVQADALSVAFDPDPVGAPDGRGDCDEADLALAEAGILAALAAAERARTGRHGLAWPYRLGAYHQAMISGLLQQFTTADTPGGAAYVAGRLSQAVDEAMSGPGGAWLPPLYAGVLPAVADAYGVAADRDTDANEPAEREQPTSDAGVFGAAAPLRLSESQQLVYGLVRDGVDQLADLLERSRYAETHLRNALARLVDAGLVERVPPSGGTVRWVTTEVDR